MIFYQQVFAEISDTYHLAGDSAHFLNMNAIFEIGIACILKFVLPLNFQMATFNFDHIFKLF